MRENVFERMDRLETRMADDYADTMKGFESLRSSMGRYYADTKEAIFELRKIMTNFDARLTFVEQLLAPGAD